VLAAGARLSGSAADDEQADDEDQDDELHGDAHGVLEAAFQALPRFRSRGVLHGDYRSWLQTLFAAAPGVDDPSGGQDDAVGGLCEHLGSVRLAGDVRAGAAGGVNAGRNGD
jgi:hypothetical protein